MRGPSDFNHGPVTIVHPSFEYHRPNSLAEACQLLRELGPGALALAGGTDVLVDIRRGSKRPRHLVSLGALSDLGEVMVDGSFLRIGALLTPARLEASAAVKDQRPELLDSIQAFGTPQVRHRATLGGSLCTAASCGDMAPLLMALGARVVLGGCEARRELSLTEFFKDHRKTALRPGEILVEVAVPVRRPGEGAAYEAFGRRAANFITVAAVAAFLRVQEGICSEARIALGAVHPTPIPVPQAEAVLSGSRLEEAAVREAAGVARNAAAPISDVRGSAEHRRELVEALCMRAIRRAQNRAMAGEGATP